MTQLHTETWAGLVGLFEAAAVPRLALTELDRPWVIGHSGEGIRPHAASAT